MHRSRLRLLVLGPLAVLLSAVAPAHAAISTRLAPPTRNVSPGDTLTVTFEVTAAGTAFNGYDLVVSYDPAALTLLPLSPVTAQQGCLMTGACSGACSNTFHRFQAAGDSASVSNVLLCNSFSLTGPGQLYVLRFVAQNVTQATDVIVRRAKFYNAGLFVGPVTTANAQIGIGVTVGVEETTGSGPAAWRAEPNPSSGRVEFLSQSHGGGLVTGEVIDVQGRVRHRWSPVWVGALGRLSWDGRGEDGARLPAGLYLVRLRQGDRVQTTRVTLLP